MARAAIDIGSNTLLLTVQDDAGNILVDEARVVGLGRGLGDSGSFAKDRMEAADLVLADFARIAIEHGVQPGEVRAVATSGARRAMNAQTWLQRVKRHTALDVRIISGDEEARLAWIGARRDLDVGDDTLLVIDLGGGSTELVLGQGEKIFGRASLEIGSVRLTEQYLGLGIADSSGLARLRNHVDTQVATIRLEPGPKTVIGTAGSVTTLAAMALGLERYDSARVHNSHLDREHLAAFTDKLLPMTPDERRAWCVVSPERADYLLAGATILDRVLLAARLPFMVVSDRGLRFGLLV